jgi:NADH:ubiquinone oxidoreductase subunit H
VALVTVAERKTMASMQRRLGPNIVGQLKLNIPLKDYITVQLEIVMKML